MRMMIALASAVLVACTPEPEIARVERSFANGEPSQIIPIEGLIVTALADSNRGLAQQDFNDFETSLASRIAALNRRANVLRGSPVNDATRNALGAL